MKSTLKINTLAANMVSSEFPKKCSSHVTDGETRSHMSSNARKEEMLFVSSMPASRSNALGIQTLYLAEPFMPAWSHCYWYNYRMGESDVPNSHRLNSKIPDLWPFATGRGFIASITERIGLAWWRGDRLIESKKPKLRQMFADVGFAYVAPIKNGDATKCREIVEAIGCPFVIHIWDLLEETLNSDYIWLFAHAEHVFCLSSTMVEEISFTAHGKTSLLTFTRPKSKYCAKQYGTGALKIALIGSLFAYLDGLELLSQAISSLRRQVPDVCLRYIGPSAQVKLIPDTLREVTDYVGFTDDDTRDKALADCHVAYLPGPMLSPHKDSRSRHSIPSRSADYMAVGLPVIAAVDMCSATNVFFSSVQNNGVFPVGKPEEICRVAQQLRDERLWTQASHACLRFFDAHFDKASEQEKLRAIAARFLAGC